MKQLFKSSLQFYKQSMKNN